MVFPSKAVVSLYAVFCAQVLHVAAASITLPVFETFLFSWETDALVVTATTSIPQNRCRVIPGDVAWPLQWNWMALNASVDGRLIKTIPAAAPCHIGPYYNASRCATISAAWIDSDFQCVALCATRPHHGH
jgi:hypothetical protein